MVNGGSDFTDPDPVSASSVKCEFPSFNEISPEPVSSFQGAVGCPLISTVPEPVSAFTAPCTSASLISPEPVPKYPYPGLRPFKTEEVAIFYGRNAQKDAILERLNQNHMVFILGSSGCGKSSLVLAGVILIAGAVISLAAGGRAPAVDQPG